MYSHAWFLEVQQNCHFSHRFIPKLHKNLLNRTFPSCKYPSFSYFPAVHGKLKNRRHLREISISKPVVFSLRIISINRSLDIKVLIFLPTFEFCLSKIIDPLLFGERRISPTCVHSAASLSSRYGTVLSLERVVLQWEYMNPEWLKETLLPPLTDRWTESTIHCKITGTSQRPIFAGYRGSLNWVCFYQNQSWCAAEDQFQGNKWLCPQKEGIFTTWIINSHYQMKVKALTEKCPYLDWGRNHRERTTWASNVLKLYFIPMFWSLYILYPTL